MSNIKWIGLAAPATLIFLVLSVFMYKVRAKYIHIVVHSDTPLVRGQNQKYESYRYESEEYGCVSLLATVLGLFFCTAAVASFVVFLFQVVVSIIPSLPKIFSVAAVINGMLLGFAFVLLLVTSVLSFLKDLFNPPR